MPLKFKGTDIRTLKYKGSNMSVGKYKGTQVFPGGNNVTYVWNGNRTTEYVNYGASCLSPSFNPTRSGASFLGWSSSSTSTTVLTSKTMGDSTITLYAVWKYADATLLDTPALWNTTSSDPITILEFTASNYETLTITAYANVHVSGGWVQNNALVFLYAGSYGVGLRYKFRIGEGEEQEESDDASGTKCYGDKEATFSVPSGSPVQITFGGDHFESSNGWVRKIVATGATVVG